MPSSNAALILPTKGKPNVNFVEASKLFIRIKCILFADLLPPKYKCHIVNDARVAQPQKLGCSHAGITDGSKLKAKKVG
jgi:hypothetical protein